MIELKQGDKVSVPSGFTLMPGSNQYQAGTWTVIVADYEYYRRKFDQGSQTNSENPFYPKIKAPE